MKTINVKIEVPDQIDAELKRVVRRRKIRKAAVVRDALIQYLKPSTSKPHSFLDGVRDLVGKLEGSGDLSFNKKRLEGYGR